MTLIGDASKDLKKIVDHLMKAQDVLDAAEPDFVMTGRKLEELCKMHPHYLAKYDKYRIDMKGLYDLVESKRETLDSKLWRKYLEGYQRALSTRDIQAYIAGDPERVILTELMLEIAHMRDQFTACVKALEDASWMLSHITKIRVAELQDTVI